jgi:hypothetical protein
MCCVLFQLLLLFLRVISSGEIRGSLRAANDLRKELVTHLVVGVMGSGRASNRLFLRRIPTAALLLLRGVD